MQQSPMRDETEGVNLTNEVDSLKRRLEVEEEKKISYYDEMNRLREQIASFDQCVRTRAFRLVKGSVAAILVFVVGGGLVVGLGYAGQTLKEIGSLLNYPVALAIIILIWLTFTLSAKAYRAIVDS